MVRLSPKLSATIFPEKTRRIGCDGNIWEVILLKNNTKRWKKSNFKTIPKIPKKQIELNGSYKGNKKIKNNDIKYSVILRKKCLENKLTLSYIKEELFIYHMFSSKRYLGRWFNVNFLKTSKYSLDGKKYILKYTIPEYEEDEPKYKVLNNVVIKIFFTKRGWEKLIKYFH